MFINNPSITSALFGASDVIMESALKNPNQYRNAILFESLSSLSDDKLNEFVNSQEAKVMVNEGILTQETIERLASDHNDSFINTTVCHMAKENGDPEWDAIVKCRIEERRLLNELIERYKDKAEVVVNGAKKEIVEGCIPDYFKNK